MGIRETIEGLRASLAHTEAEGELLAEIAAGLTTLREAFRAERSQFSAEDIEFLRSLADTSERLRAFVSLREEAAAVSSVEQYEELLRRLRGVKDGFGAMGVGRRVGLAMRELHGRLPGLLERDTSRQEFRRFRGQFRVLQMQRTARLCPFGHPMVLEERAEGLVWACSRKPECGATAELTPEELAAAAGSAPRR